MIDNRKRVCLVTCYSSPEYIRVKTLQAAFECNDNVELSIVRNNSKSMLRYLEVFVRLVKERLKNNPDIYVVTFRGYEILPVVLLIGLGKKIVFDEFINLVEWIVYEHKKIKPHGVLYRLLMFFYGSLLKRTTAILTDTAAHADYSADLMGIQRSKYLAIPVATEEEIFRPLKREKDSRGIKVFYYGSMLPLHGIEYVIESATRLGSDEKIEFLLVGGDSVVKEKIEDAVRKGARIEYRDWIPYEQLPQAIADADICLGGPFGNTVQSQLVITGKTYQFMASEKVCVIGKNLATKISYLRDKQNCLIVEQANAEALTSALKWCIDSEYLLSGIGEAARFTYLKHMSVAVASKKLEQLLYSVEA